MSVCVCVCVCVRACVCVCLSGRCGSCYGNRKGHSGLTLAAAA